MLERDSGGMAEGAVAICANPEHPPPESWIIMNDSLSDLRRGAWVKPHRY